MKGRSTRVSSSLRRKKAQTCRERSRTEPASRTCLGWLIVLLLAASASRCGPVAHAGARPPAAAVEVGRAARRDAGATVADVAQALDERDEERERSRCAL